MKLELAAIGLAICLGIWFAPEIRERFAGVQTSVRTCPPPAEFEVLHVVVRMRDGQVFVDDCLYLGSRGTYQRGRR